MKILAQSLLGVCLAFISLHGEPLDRKVENDSIVVPSESFYIDSDSGVSDVCTSLGTVTVNGSNIADQNDNTIPVISVSEDETNILVEFHSDLSNGWELTDSSSKTLGDLKLGQKMKSGVISFETSIDGENWISDIVVTDYFSEENEYSYSITDFQKDNDTCFRITIGAAFEKKLDSKKLFVLDDYEKAVVSETFEFQVQADHVNNLTIESTPRHFLGTVKKTGLDNGFMPSGEVIDGDDPHFSWKMGRFVLNGYTENNGEVYFKNLGDTVTLWFDLEQDDLNALNGNNHLIVSKDENGSDQTMQVKATNFKRGALLIQRTDFEGTVYDPVIYTDFLAACSTNKAETRILLKEEGDYKVILDYEIQDDSSPIPGKKDYYNYQIQFDFSIRNGNVMVYPFDIKTRDELMDGALTDNGFTLDLSNSQYLSINVKEYSVNREKNGTVKTEIRKNRPAKEGTEYTSKGMYEITVSSPYTGESVTKTIYVGLDTETVELLENRK